MVEQPSSQKAQDWAQAPCFDEKTKQEVSALIRDEQLEEIEERFGSELEFGTGGLRGLVGSGTSRLNPYTIRKATTALCLYLKNFYKDKKQLKVAISFDSRVTSKEFSEVTAEVLAYYGIHVYLTENLRPTPALSFMVRYFSCQAGICLTASHNPPAYNGYKVYWEDGGQIVTPHDKEIINKFSKLNDYGALSFLDFEIAKSQGLIHYCDRELDKAYLEMAKKVSYRKPNKTDQKIVYSALHGAGGTLLPRVLKDRAYNNLLLVPEQKDPDGLFPTVKSPNPEDEEALSLSKLYADKMGASLVMATDPDADRLAVCVKENGAWVNLNGNQLATLLTYYILEAIREQGESFEKAYIVKTVVTTDLLFKIASSYSCGTRETLTGFKWIADTISKEEALGHKFLCGGEESLGFLAKDYVRDKDAVTTAALVCELLSHCDEKGETLLGYLDQIYAKFGFYCEALETMTLSGISGRKKIQEMMSFFRNFDEELFLGEKLLEKCDYLKQTRISNFGKSKENHSFTDFPKSDVISFAFESGLKVMVRPSGTEAKIKFYFFHQENLELFKNESSLEKRREKTLKELSNFRGRFVNWGHSL